MLALPVQAGPDVPQKARWSAWKQEKEIRMSETPQQDGDTSVKNRKPSLIAHQVWDGKDDASYWDRVGVA